MNFKALYLLFIFLSSLIYSQESNIKTFKIAIAATPDFVDIIKRTPPYNNKKYSRRSDKEIALLAIKNYINDINEVFIRELSIKFELVSDERTLISQGEKNPFQNDSYNSNFWQGNIIQNFLDEKIGDKNYDIGHLFHSSSQVGGLSHYGTVCKKGRKARAVSAYDFVGQWRKKEMLHREFEGILMHEIGHQFNAQHTFSFEIEGRAIGAQVEPASGSTIMAYPGVAAPDNIQTYKDLYFNHVSINTMKNFIESLDCGTNELKKNKAPSIFLENNTYNIPKGTAILLSGVNRQQKVYQFRLKIV